MSQERLSLADILSMYDSSSESQQEDPAAPPAQPEEANLTAAGAPEPRNSLAAIFAEEVDTIPNLEDLAEPDFLAPLAEPKTQETPWHTEQQEPQDEAMLEELQEQMVPAQEDMAASHEPEPEPEIVWQAPTEPEPVPTPELYTAPEAPEYQEAQVVLDVSAIDAGDIFGQVEAPPVVENLQETMNIGSDYTMKTMTFGEHAAHEVKLSSGNEYSGLPAFSQVIATPNGEYRVNQPEEVTALHQELADVMTEVEQILARLHKSWDASEELTHVRAELESAVKSANTGDIMRLGERIAQLGDTVKLESPSKTELSRLVMKLEIARSVFARYIDILWHC